MLAVMTITQTIVKNTAIQIVGKMVSTTLGLVAVVIMTRYLGAEHFGWYVTATGFLQYIGIVSDFGFTVTTSNMLAEGVFDRTRLFRTIFTWRFLTSLIFQGLAPLIILLFPYPVEVKIAVAITTLSFFAISLAQVFIGYYREVLQLKTVVYAELIGRLLLVLGVALVAYKSWGFLPIMAVITIGSVANTIYLWFKAEPIRFLIDRTISRALFYKMWPTAMSVMFNACYLQADRVILPLYASQAIVGLYGAAYRVLDIIIQIAALIMGMVMPVITAMWAQGRRQEFTARYQFGFDLMAMILIPIIVGTFILAKPIMYFVAGAEFSAASTMLKWLSISIFGVCFGMIFGHIALAINRQREALWIYASDAVLSLIGYFYFIPLYGWWGAAIVTIFSEIYAGLLLTILTIYYSKTRPHILNLVKIFLASAGMGALLILYPSLPFALAILVGGLSYGLLLIILRAITLAQIKAALFPAFVAKE